MKQAVTTLAAFTIAGAAGRAGAVEVHLECTGFGTVQTSQMTQASAYGSSGASANGIAFSSGTEQRPGAASVDITDTAGRVRVPRDIVPSIHMGEHDGWWDLYDVKASDSEIVARFRLNPLNKPMVRINRLTGAIEIRGSFDFGFFGWLSARDPRAALILDRRKRDGRGRSGVVLVSLSAQWRRPPVLRRAGRGATLQERRDLRCLQD